MDNLNNLYNFKNPIRHFFNLDAMCFNSSEEVEFGKLSRYREAQERAGLKMLGINKCHPAFFTQLVYRLHQIEEHKYKRVFLINFFKTFYGSASVTTDAFLFGDSITEIDASFRALPENLDKLL